MNDEEPLPSDFVVTDRRGSDRRNRTDRRKRQIPVACERRSGKDRRQRGERRRQVDPTTCEKDYSDEEIDFMKAMDLYKRRSGRQLVGGVGIAGAAQHARDAHMGSRNCSVTLASRCCCARWDCRSSEAIVSRCPAVNVWDGQLVVFSTEQQRRPADTTTIWWQSRVTTSPADPGAVDKYLISGRRLPRLARASLA